MSPRSTCRHLLKIQLVAWTFWGQPAQLSTSISTTRTITVLITDSLHNVLCCTRRRYTHEYTCPIRFNWIRTECTLLPRNALCSTVIQQLCNCTVSERLNINNFFSPSSLLRLPISVLFVLVMFLCCITSEILLWQPHCHLTPPPGGTPANIRIRLIFPETRVIGLHFSRWQYGSIFIRLAVVASQIYEVAQNSTKFELIGVQGHPRSSILAPIESAHTTSY